MKTELGLSDTTTITHEEEGGIKRHKSRRSRGGKRSDCRFEAGARESGHGRRWTTTESKTRKRKQEPSALGRNNKRKADLGVRQNKGDSVGRGKEERARSGILTAPIPDKTFNIFCIKKVWRAQSALTAVWLHEMTGRLLPNKGEGSLSQITGQILVGGNQIGFKN